MQKIESRIQFFNEPFGLTLMSVYRMDCWKYVKFHFGAEPKDYEVYGYLLKNWRLSRFSLPVKADETHCVTRIDKSTYILPPMGVATKANALSSS